MKNFLVILLGISFACPTFSQSFKYFLVEKNIEDQVSFQFKSENIKDMAVFYFFLRKEFGKEQVSGVKGNQFTLQKNMNYSDFLHCLYKSKINYHNIDLENAKKVLTLANIQATLNPAKSNIQRKREPVENCLIEVDATHTLAENVNSCDDCSTEAIPLQFSYNFCGSFYDQVYLNSNGNITFDNPYFVYNSIGIPNSSTAVMLAPLWADYDIRSCENQRVTYKSESNRFIVTYNEVGHYNNNCERTNTFQVVITDGTDEYVGVGNNTAFYYGDVQWTTGDASYGENGFGGTPATVGINKNDGMSYAVIGRFNEDSEAYDGPDGAFDGINYLDNKCFTFKSEDCNIDNCSISNLQAILDINCETTANGLFTDNYLIDVFTSGGVGDLSISGDVNAIGRTILSTSAVVDNTINVSIEDSFGCVSVSSVAVPDCTNPEPTCSDGIQNGTETGVDCGGNCSACAKVCVNEPGIMQTSNSFVCSGKSIFIKEAFSEIAEGSVKAYVMHEQKNFDGLNYIEMSSNSRIYSPGATYHNKPLYISALIGPPNEDGFPSFDDPCTVWTPYGAYVLFFDPVDINIMDERCEERSYFIDVQLKGGVGGVSPNRAFKTVTDGKKMYRNMSPDDILSFGPYERSGSYFIQAAGAKGCKGTLNDDYVCSGLNRLLNYTANSEIIRVAYLDEDISIENIEVFNLKGQNIVSEASIDQYQAEIKIQNEVMGLLVVKVLLSNNEFDYIKIMR